MIRPFYLIDMGFKQIARRAGGTLMFLPGKTREMTKAASMLESSF